MRGLIKHVARHHDRADSRHLCAEFELTQAIETSRGGNQRLRFGLRELIARSDPTNAPMKHVIALHDGGKWRPQPCPAIIEATGALGAIAGMEWLRSRKF
jgi:hypothetical protein